MTVRYTIVWSDAMVSMSFDRPPIATRTRCSLPFSSQAMNEGLSYCEGMYALCHTIIENVKLDETPEPDFHEILRTCDKVESWRKRLRPALQSPEACQTLQDTLHHYAFNMHTSFVVSVVCRPSLRHVPSRLMDAQQTAIIVARCKANLTQVVRLYLKMAALSTMPVRSWAFTFGGLSSAVLLGILGETRTNPEVRQLQGQLISVLSAAMQAESTGLGSKDASYTGPLSRALAALEDIYAYGYVPQQDPTSMVDLQPLQITEPTMAGMSSNMMEPR